MSNQSQFRRAELHTHSTASDGDFEPERVAQLCAEAGVDVWALTDHDNCAGCARARRAARDFGIEFIPGIEISAYLRRSIHVLGYGIDPTSSVLQRLSSRLREARSERMAKMLGRLQKEGIELSKSRVESIADGSPLSRSHLAEALIAEGIVRDKDEAFRRWIGADAPAYVPVGWPSIPETIARIHAAGGAAVLAHPGRYDVDDRIPAWVDAGLDGIEVEHPRHDEADVARYRAIASEFELVPTVSSDFHGWEHRSAAYFGEVEVRRDTLKALRRAISRHS